VASPTTLTAGSTVTLMGVRLTMRRHPRRAAVYAKNFGGSPDDIG